MNTHVLYDVEAAYKSTMQLKCDESDKNFDNSRDITEIHLDLLSFSKQLAHATAKSPPTGFPKNPPSASKGEVVSYDPIPWRDLGLEVHANRKSVKLFKAETYK